MTHKSLLILVLFIFANSPQLSFSQNSIPEEMIVIGRQPGPPMWQVQHGENILWIFPYVSWLPKDMIWTSENVEKVIASSQEVITRPDINISISKLVMLNPINIIRGLRLGKRLSRNPDGSTLAEVLPEELYTRFSALKSEYFPKNASIEKQRPVTASDRMIEIIHKHSGLVLDAGVSKKIKKLIKKNKSIKTTDIEVNIQLKGKYKSIANRMENLITSLSKEQELVCFEQRLTRMETDLDETKYRANAWALGYIDEFKHASLAGSADDDCNNLFLASSENETIETLLKQMNQQWIDAAESALAANQSTFAVLSIVELLRDDGLLDQLKQKGYKVIEP